MALQFSVFLLSIFFTAGHSFYCYQCTDLTETCVKKTVMCPWGASKCVSSTLVVEIGGFRSKMKIYGCSLGCESGSMNLGILKSTYSCCDTNFCNAKDAPDPNTIVRNGKTCYYCDGQSCSNTLSCSGTEDRCITATQAIGGRATVVKGCVSNVICHSKTLANSVQDISCCKGNLCNGDESIPQSVTQSFIQNVTQSFMYNGDKSDAESFIQNVTQNVTQSFMYNGDKSDAESFIQNVTQSFIQNVTQSFMYNGDKSDAESFIQSVTQSFVYDNAEIVKHNDVKSAMYSDAKSVKKSFMYNDASSVSQSFLFLCCSLLSFILLH